MMTPAHHALLLGFFMEEILDGPEGDALISEAVCRYGQGRGRRMAERAARDGRSNDLLGFLLYGEINWDDTGNRFKIQSRKPFFSLAAEKCFWHGIWTARGMETAGRLYCRDIDRYLLLKKKIKRRAVQSWTFHCRDVFTVFSGVILERAQDTSVIGKTIHRFSAEFGESAISALTAA